MILVAVTLLLFLTITFFQTIQGTFSALIMAVITLMSAAVAVNFYSPLSQACMTQLPIGWMEYTDAMCLAVVFFATLIVLRVLSDRFVRGNIVMNVWADRAIAAVISIPTALVLVGMTSLSVQMLPLDQSLMFFERFTEVEHMDAKVWQRNSVFPKADDFAASMAGMLCANALSSTGQFSLIHPDWPGELSAQRIGIQPESRHAVPPGSAKAKRMWKLEKPLLVKEYQLLEVRRQTKPKITLKGDRNPQQDHYYLAVDMELTPKAADADGLHRFSWGQARLVGFLGDDRRHPMNVYMIGFKDQDVEGEWNYMRIKIPLPLEKGDAFEEIEQFYRNFGVISRGRPSGPEIYSVVFEVPDDFEPWFLEYKRWARSSLPKLSDGPATEDGSEDNEEESEDDETDRVSRRGWRSQFQIDYQRSAFTDEVPFTLTAAAGSRSLGSGPNKVDLSQMRYASGAISGTVGQGEATDLDSRTGGKLAVVRKFFVPSDKRLFRLECRLDGAETRLLRQVFGAVQNISQRYIFDSDGTRYFPVGQYAIVNEGELVELQYEPDAMSSGYAKPFRKVNVSQMTGKDVQIGFLYHVEPGATLDRFEIGGTPMEAQNLKRYTAP